VVYFCQFFCALHHRNCATCGGGSGFSGVLQHSLALGCSHALSLVVRQQVDTTLSLTQLRTTPGAYKDRIVMLGGDIVSTRNLTEGTRLVLSQYPTDRRGRPQTAAPSGGRFLGLAPEYLETAIYRSGRVLTVAREVRGQRNLPVGETMYPYPLLAPREMYLWPEGSGGSPLFHFGFGFGCSRSL
jgi:outer membrane lipoprotein